MDLRYAARSLLRDPGFSAVAIVLLGLAIGANTTIFSLVNDLLLYPLSAAQPHELVRIGATQHGQGFYAFSYPELRNLRDHNSVFSGVVGHELVNVSLDWGSGPTLVYGELVSRGYFDVLGVQMASGRGFLPEEDATPMTHPMLVVGHDLWQRQLGADPDIVGRTMKLNGRTFTVVGVAPPSFTGTFLGLRPQLWVPTMMLDAVRPGREELSSVDHRFLMLIARLKPGVSVERARAEVEILERRLRAETPALREAEIGVSVVPARGVHPFLAGMIGAFLALLMAVVGLVLLAACTNLAGLALARGFTRRGEISVRAALGAGRLRIVRQLLIESVVLALLGGVLGLLLAAWAMRLIEAFRPPTDVPIWVDLGIDVRVLLFSLGTSLIAALAFGLVPALHPSKLDLVPGLRGDSTGLRRSRLRGMLVVGQVALSLILLIGAALLSQSLINSADADPGFEPRGVFTLRLGIQQLGYDLERAHDLHETVVERLRMLPGVEQASVAGWVPLGDRGDTVRVEVEGWEPAAGESGFVIDYNLAGSDYFRTLRVELLRGRRIRDSDREGTNPVVVINQTMADRFWPDEEALGKRILIAGEQSWREIVGVAANGKYRIISEDPHPYLYIPWRQFYRSDLTLQLRTSVESSSVLPAVRAAVRAIDDDVAIFDARPLVESMAFSMVPMRLAATVLGAAGVIGMLLTALGVAGTVALVLLAVTAMASWLPAGRAIHADPATLLRRE